MRLEPGPAPLHRQVHPPPPRPVRIKQRRHLNTAKPAPRQCVDHQLPLPCRVRRAAPSAATAPATPAEVPALAHQPAPAMPAQPCAPTTLLAISASHVLTRQRVRHIDRSPRAIIAQRLRRARPSASIVNVCHSCAHLPPAALRRRSARGSRIAMNPPAPATMTAPAHVHADGTSPHTIQPMIAPQTSAMYSCGATTAAGALR